MKIVGLGNFAGDIVIIFELMLPGDVNPAVFALPGVITNVDDPPTMDMPSLDTTIDGGFVFNSSALHFADVDKNPYWTVSYRTSRCILSVVCSNWLFLF